MTFSRTCLFATIALSLTVFASSFASAQDDVRKRGDRACGGDSRKMCSKFFGQGDMMVLGCSTGSKSNEPVPWNTTYLARRCATG